MYTLKRKRDGLTFERNNFKNVRYKMDGNSLTDFPPEVGCGMFVWSQMSDYWQTTIIKKIEKISDFEYKVFTKNSEYLLTKSE